jgi:hypothetical protein
MKIHKNKEKMKEKKRFLHMWRFPYSCVFHWSNMPLSYCLHVTLPQENPLVWDLPYKIKPSFEEITKETL